MPSEGYVILIKCVSAEAPCNELWLSGVIIIRRLVVLSVIVTKCHPDKVSSQWNVVVMKCHLNEYLMFSYWSIIVIRFTFYLPHSLADPWGTTVDFTTSFLYSSRFSAFRGMIFHSRPVHSLMLSSHRFLYLSLRFAPWTVLCRIVLASTDGCVMWPYHFSLRLFIEVRR